MNTETAAALCGVAMLFAFASIWWLIANGDSLDQWEPEGHANERKVNE